MSLALERVLTPEPLKPVAARAPEVAGYDPNPVRVERG